MKYYFTLTSLEMSVMLEYAKKYAESIGYKEIDKSSWRTFIRAVESGKYKNLAKLFENVRQVEEWGCNGVNNALALNHYQDSSMSRVELDADELVESVRFFYCVLSSSFELRDKKNKFAGRGEFVEDFSEFFLEGKFDVTTSPMKIAFALLFKTKDKKEARLEKEEVQAILNEARHISFEHYALLKKAMLGNNGYSFMILPITIKGLEEPTYAVFLNAKGSIRNISSYFYNGGRKESMLFGYNGFYEADTQTVHPSLVASSQFLWESPSGIIERMGRRIFGNIKFNPNIINLDNYSFVEEILAPSILLGGVK